MSSDLELLPLETIQLIATDMDGTLTQAGRLRPQVLQLFEALHQVGVHVIIITGRSAGWVEGLAHYLPIYGAIAENGGIFYAGHYSASGISKPYPLVSLQDLKCHRQGLQSAFEQLQQVFPGIQPSSDNVFRLTDWTYDRHDLALSHLQTMADLSHTMGWDFIYSSVQCHLKLFGQDKASGLLKVLETQSDLEVPLDQIVTIGDSPNDSSLFNPAYFTYSVGVSNCLDYQDQMLFFPNYLTQAEAGWGFCELAEALLQAKGSL